MTISSSLNAGIMGLSVNATRLATISDNIANSDTYGYKRAVADFQSMVISQRDNAYSAGGVRVQAGRAVSEQGSLISTGNSTDIAVAGRGMLPVTNLAGTATEVGDRALFLTPTGSFAPDQDGFLRTTSGLFLMGWPTDANGDVNAISRQSGTNLEPININVSRYVATPTSRIGLGVNLPADATGVGAPGDPFETPIEYFDNLGRSQVLTARFTPTPGATAPSNAWSIEVFDNSTGSPVSVSSLDIAFNDTTNSGGSVASVTANPTYDAATGEITVGLPSGPVQVFVGRPGDATGVTQLATDFAPYGLVKDGAPVGDLVSVEINGRGELDAIYDSGFRRTIYQVPVADVPNLNGLVATDAQSFRVSQASGDLYFWDAGTGPVGETIGYGLMESTVDIAGELTGLIETQRAYASNAKVIQTVDEMLQETTNIKR